MPALLEKAHALAKARSVSDQVQVDADAAEVQARMEGDTFRSDRFRTTQLQSTC